MDITVKMANEKISKLMWQFCIPTVLAMLINSLYNIVDRIFVGNIIGSHGSAAITF